MLRTRHARRVTAVWLCVAWLLGFELGPDLHQALHTRLAAHHHDGDHVDGPVRAVHTDGEVHHHGGVTHRHSGPAPSEPRPRLAIDQAAFVPEAPAPGHGAHSAAHRGLALATAPPVITAPLPVVRTLVPVATRAERSRADAPTPIAAARGPPAA